MKIYTLDEVSKMLKISVSTLRKHLGNGQLKASKLGRRIRITEDQLKEYLKDNELNNKK